MAMPTSPPSVVHFSSIFVDDTNPHSSAETARVTLQLIERDVGLPDDFCSIHLDLVIRPTTSPPSSRSISVDHLLALRHLPAPSAPIIHVYARAALPFSTLTFPNGPEACNAFIIALRTHVNLRHLVDPYQPGTLYSVDPKPRMRRAAPSLMPLPYPQPNPRPSPNTASPPNQPLLQQDDFNALLSDLNISSQQTTTSKPSRDANGIPAPHHELAINFLSQFARVTQVAREVGQQIVTFVDDDLRRRKEERRRSLQSARVAALDLNARIVASSQVEHELPPRLQLETPRGLPVSLKAWQFALASDGHLKDPLVIRHATASGGCQPDLRPIIWPFLLNVYPWRSTSLERLDMLRKCRTMYASLKERTNKLQHDAEEASAAMKSDSEDDDGKLPAEHANRLQVCTQISKDVVRTDRKLACFKDDDSAGLELMSTILNVYAVYNPTIAYCQGMSDFVAPIIAAVGVEDEAMLFWCFERLMRRMEANFRVDQSGIQAQLRKLRRIIEEADAELARFFQETDQQYYTCFRWVVVQFKREMAFEDTTRLWEVLWSQLARVDDYHIFVVAGLLLAHRERLLKMERGAFDGLLRYINDMSMRIDVDFAIRQGEIAFQKWGSVVSKTQ